MKKKKLFKLDSTVSKKPIPEISEVHALLDVMKAIKIKESQIKQKKKSKATVCKN